MLNIPFDIQLKRRAFLTQSAYGLGGVAFASLLERADAFPGVISKPHFPIKAKRVIHLCMAGGPSHLETFDWKPEMAGKPGGAEAIGLADLFCKNARRRIQANFKALWNNDDAAKYKVALDVLGGRHTWLEQGVVGPQLASLAPASEKEREPELVGSR